MSFFISDAWADAGPAAAQQAPSVVPTLFMFGALLAMMYFMIWRPQSKRAKEHRDLLGSMSKGDEVVVNGAILGRVTKITDDFVALEIADGVEIKVQKFAITATLPKGTLKQIKDSA